MESNYNCSSHQDHPAFFYCSKEAVFLCNKCFPQHRSHLPYLLEELYDIDNLGSSNQAFSHDALKANLEKIQADLLNFKEKMEFQVQNIAELLLKLKKAPKQSQSMKKFDLNLKPNSDDIEKELQWINWRKGFEKELEDAQENYFIFFNDKPMVNLPSFSHESLIFFMTWGTDEYFTYDVNKKQRKSGKLVHKCDKGGSRFFVNKDEVYAMQALNNAKSENYLISLDGSLKTLANCIKNVTNSSILKFKDQIFIFRENCQIYDITNDKWTKSLELKCKDHMPAVSLYSNRYIFVFPNQAPVEVLDLHSMETGFQILETIDNGYERKNYAEAIQIDMKNILVFGGGNPESAQSYKFNVVSKSFTKTKTQLSVKTCFYNNSQPIILTGKVYAIDYKKRIFCYEIMNEEWSIFAEL